MRVAAASCRAIAAHVIPPRLPVAAGGRLAQHGWYRDARCMVSASTTVRMAKKGKGGGGGGDGGGGAGPKRPAEEAETMSFSPAEPSRFGRGTGRRRTATERADAAAKLAQQHLRAATAGVAAGGAGPLPGAASTPEEIAAAVSSLKKELKHLGVADNTEEAWDATEAMGEFGALGAMERTKAAATRLMDLTSTGPVRVRGEAALKAQVERQAVFHEAKARREFYRERQTIQSPEELGLEEDGNASFVLPTSDLRGAGFDEDDLKGPRGAKMDVLVGETVKAWMTEDSEREDGISGPFGTAPVAAVSHGVVAELSQPVKYVMPAASDDSDDAGFEPTLNKDFTRGSFGIVNPRLTPEEQTMDAERRALRAKFLDPIPIPNQPIHQQYIYLANTTQHHKIVRGGMETTEKAMAILGNGCGGIGFGIASHKQADRAVELAISAAQRDMIHVSLYKGQLYHDLVGRKNNIKVILWSKSPAHEKPSGDHTITTVMELMGVKHYSAKIIGPKRRNPFTVAQALFNAFDGHKPYDVSASERGLRLLRLGADRFRPRQAFPMSAAGPSHSSASSYRYRTNR